MECGHETEPILRRMGYQDSLIPVNRGAAYLDGMLFRGTEDGRVLAYDFKTGKRIWERPN